MIDGEKTWTPERVELLKKFWEDGLTAAQIAAQMPGIGRNAVIGKVHRLGLSGRLKNALPRKPQHPNGSQSGLTMRARGNARPRSKDATGPVIMADIIPPEQRRSLLELEKDQCHWPVGEPLLKNMESGEFYFCGASTVTGLQYCAGHARMMYGPSPDKRRDARHRPLRF